MIRPDIVWFGEMLPADQWHIAESASENADVMLCYGYVGRRLPCGTIADDGQENMAG